MFDNLHGRITLSETMYFLDNESATSVYSICYILLIAQRMVIIINA